MITTGHLCSGYDGLAMGLTLAGEAHRPLWHAESGDAPAALLAREFPDVPNVGDLTAPIWGMAPHVDLLTAGFPCQPVSVAGRQLAENDPRWLWPGVLNVIREVKPWRVFLENVRNIVSIQRGAILRLILDDLRAAGYAARWVTLGACVVGAPHHRHRWFLIADHVGTGAPEAVRIRPQDICGAPRGGGRLLLPSPRTSDRFGAGRPEGRQGGDDLRTTIALLPTPTARDGDTRGEGSPEFWTEREAGRSNGKPLGAAVTLLPTPRATDGTNGGPNQRNGRDEYDALPGLTVNEATWGRFAEAVALWEHITGVPAPEPTEAGPKGGHRLSALLPEWMMGLPPGYLTREATRVKALTMAGNGVVPRQAAAAYELLTS